GGTDNHLMLVDVSTVGLTGKEADEILGTVNITANKNAIPYDKEKPSIASGVRVGTPAVTTRGMVEEDMAVIADAFEAALIKKDLEKAREKVNYLTQKYPLYAE
ncbi:MAG: serine hydroxymethyltransferase, partial [Eubacterium sp.]